MQYGDPVWEQVISTQGWGKYPGEEVIRFFMRTKAKLNKGLIKVLDIGAGIGSNVWFMTKEGGQVVAFDGAPTALKKLPDIMAYFGINEPVETVLGDIVTPKKFINGRFDIFLDNYSLCANSYEQFVNAFKDYYELLPEGGYFLTNCFGKKTTGFGTGERINENTHKYVTEGALYHRGMISFFDRDELTRIFTDIGYKIHYVENLLDDRNGMMVEKLVTCLGK